MADLTQSNVIHTSRVRQRDAPSCFVSGPGQQTLSQTTAPEITSPPPGRRARRGHGPASAAKPPPRRTAPAAVPAPADSDEDAEDPTQIDSQAGEDMSEDEEPSARARQPARRGSRSLPARLPTAQPSTRRSPLYPLKFTGTGCTNFTNWFEARLTSISNRSDGSGSEEPLCEPDLTIERFANASTHHPIDLLFEMSHNARCRVLAEWVRTTTLRSGADPEKGTFKQYMLHLQRYMYHAQGFSEPRTAELGPDWSFADSNIYRPVQMAKNERERVRTGGVNVGHDLATTNNVESIADATGHHASTIFPEQARTRNRAALSRNQRAR